MNTQHLRILQMMSLVISIIILSELWSISTITHRAGNTEDFLLSELFDQHKIIECLSEQIVLSQQMKDWQGNNDHREKWFTWAKKQYIEDKVNYKTELEVILESYDSQEWAREYRELADSVSLLSHKLMTYNDLGFVCGGVRFQKGADDSLYFGAMYNQRMDLLSVAWEMDKYVITEKFTIEIEPRDTFRVFLEYKYIDKGKLVTQQWQQNYLLRNYL